MTAIDPAADSGELARLGLSAFSFETMTQGWQTAGFAVTTETLPSGHPYQTTWWRKIRQREARQAIRLTARRPWE